MLRGKNSQTITKIRLPNATILRAKVGNLFLREN
jgi:hypothetical protein